jgi:hypothetical protein
MRPPKDVIQSFYYPPVHFLCRFCAQSIGKFIGKQVKHLENFRQVKVQLSGGQAYQFTACRDCIEQGISDAHIKQSLINDGHSKELNIIPNSLSIISLKGII